MNAQKKHEPARLAGRPEDYARFKIAKGHIEQWEDSIRLNPAEPNIEWWYFDSLLDDGAKLAITFCNKDPGARGHQPLVPLIEIDLDMPDGRRLMKYGRFKEAEFEASRDGCDVHIGNFRFTGDLHEYTITSAAEDVSADVRLEGMTESWRPETGHILFGAEDEDFLAWLIAVPMGKVTATYHIGSEVHESTGLGYHDHNWCNQPYMQMGHMLDHWFWGRGRAGPYSFVTANITAAQKYRLAQFPLYMLARDGVVIADDTTKMTFTRSGSQIDEHNGKPIPDSICFDYLDGDRRYVLTYARQRTLVSQKNIDFTSGLVKVVAELIKYPGGYLRFSGPLILDCYQGGEVVEHYEETGSFEECYFASEIHGDQ
jgi:hypothetical protein